MKLLLLALLSLGRLQSFVAADFQVDAMIEMRKQLIDTRGVLNDWKENQMSPCYWINVNCDGNNVINIMDFPVEPPWKKETVPVRAGVEVPMCLCGSPCRLVRNLILGDWYGMRMWMCSNYEYDPPHRTMPFFADGRRQSPPPLCEFVQLVDPEQSEEDKEFVRAKSRAAARRFQMSLEEDRRIEERRRERMEAEERRRIREAERKEREDEYRRRRQEEERLAIPPPGQGGARSGEGADA